MNEFVRHFELALINKATQLDIERVDDYDLVHQIRFFVMRRPLELDFAIEVSKKCFLDRGDDFRGIFISEFLKKCPIVVYRMFLYGLIDILKIKQCIEKLNETHAKLYFLDFYNETTIKNILPKDCVDNGQLKHDVMREYYLYGFPKKSEQYCLKYDDIQEFSKILSNPLFSPNESLRWSIFEWSEEPFTRTSLDLACYFGSVKCAKLLMMNYNSFSDGVIRNILCGGSIDLFYCLQDQLDLKIEFIEPVALYLHIDLLKWFLSHKMKQLDFSVLSHSIVVFDLLKDISTGKITECEVFC